jgi:serine/threonine protein phosphatase 1
VSKWRPIAKDCLYFIPDIHGNVQLLENIFARILPLRKSDGGKDRLIFAGDYIDRHVDSHKVIDLLIQVEEKYGDQVVFLMGNHEMMMLQALDCWFHEMKPQPRALQFQMWINNGGLETIHGYLQRAGIEDKILTDHGSGGYVHPWDRIKDIVPKEHIEFLKRLKKYYELDNYVFVHGGLDPTESPSEQDLEVLVWDRSLVKFVLGAIESDKPLPWDKIVVTGHNVLKSKTPIVKKDKYFMLDCGSPKQLLVAELRSLKGYMSYPDQSRLVRYDLIETKKSPSLSPMFTRIKSDEK